MLTAKPFSQETELDAFKIIFLLWFSKAARSCGTPHLHRPLCSRGTALQEGARQPLGLLQLDPWAQVLI